MRYRRNPNTAGRVIEGLAFVVTPGDNKLHTLNPTATCLWTLASDGLTPDEAADALVRSYRVGREQALSDAEICLADLVSRQILVGE